LKIIRRRKRPALCRQRAGQPADARAGAPPFFNFYGGQPALKRNAHPRVGRCWFGASAPAYARLPRTRFLSAFRDNFNIPSHMQSPSRGSLIGSVCSYWPLRRWRAGLYSPLVSNQ
jgi:hypothetical protein